MKIDASRGNIEVIGDIKEFKTSIDPKNLEYITTLLSSNLYSDPEQSFIREIVSNAWDSHVEANTTDTPVIIRFKNDNYNKSITIRDYGTGLSPERFAEVYCNIGSSTKRESNDFIGGFGIGKYSSLACSNTVYITSYYNNIAYYYVMVKSGNSITTNLLREQPTTEKNGVEVTIRNISNIRPYENALDYIVFFPNVYIDGIVHYLNDTQLKRFKNFAVSSRSITHKLLLGNVLYPCNLKLLPKDVEAFLNTLSYTGIVIKFDIGELSITPNRENVIYTSDTVDKISFRVREAKKELLEMVSKKLSKDYQNLEEYYKCFSRSLWYNPIDDTIKNSSYVGFKVNREYIEDMDITYKGINLKEELENLYLIFNSVIPNYKGVVYDDKIYTNHLTYNTRSWDHIKAKKILICKDNPRLTVYIKSFLREYYNYYTLVGDITEDIVKKHIESHINDYGPTSPNKHKDLIIKGVYEAILSKSTTIDFNSDTSYLAYKQKLSSLNSSVKVIQKETILYEYPYKYSYRRSRKFNNFTDAINYIKGLKQGVILGNMDYDDAFWLSLAKTKNHAYIKANKDTISNIKSLNLKCIVDIDWLLKEDPLINRVYTVCKYFPSGLREDFLELEYSINKDLYEEFKSIENLLSIDYVYRGYCTTVGKIDKYTEYLCQTLIKYLNKWKEAKSVIDRCSDSRFSKVMTAAVLLKTKSYRVNNRAYCDVRDNKLLKILCKR